MKIYEVLDPRNGVLYNIDMLNEIKNKDIKRFDLITDHIVCPCCKKNAIEFQTIEGKNTFTTDNKLHDVTCQYYGEKISDKQLVELKNKNDQSLGAQTKHYLDILNSQSLEPLSYYIDSKYMKLKLNKYDYNTTKAFYGVCQVAFNGTTEEGINNFTLTFTQSNEVINLGIGKKCSELMPKEQLNLLKRNNKVKIVVIASLKRTNRFNNCFIGKTKSILVQK